MTRIVVIDFETTGMQEDDRPVEIGWVIVEGGAIGDRGSMLCNPGRPINVEAMAIHHITEAMVAGERSVAEALSFVLGDVGNGCDVLAAHNVAFDRKFAGPGGLAQPWLCTLKAARRVWPDAPSHSNQVLRYWLGLDLDPAACQPAHRAGADAFVTANILLRLMERASVEDMIAWTDQPSLLARMPFGKHRGEPFARLPRDYLEWIARQADIDPDVKFTAEQALGESDGTRRLL